MQVAASLPMFLFAVPAGALADIVDRRKFLIVAEIMATVVSAAFAAIIWLGLATPYNLLVFTFLIGASAALTAPVWQSVVPQLVPKRDLHPAIAANSVGINVSRAVGPALAGVLVTRFGLAAPFWLNAISNFGVIGGLLWWKPRQMGNRDLPAERFGNAIRTGFRYVRNNSFLQATLIRSTAFFLLCQRLLGLMARTETAALPIIGMGRRSGWWRVRSGRPGSNRHGQLGSSVLHLWPHLRTLRPACWVVRSRRSPQFPGVACPIWHGSGTGQPRDGVRSLRRRTRGPNVATPGVSSPRRSHEMRSS